jgi:hypothetical protein
LTTTPITGPRSYVAGGRKPRRGLTENLGEAGTGLLFGGLLVVILVMAFAGFLPALVTLLLLGLLLFALTRRDRHHRSVLQRIGERAGWAWTKKKGAHVLTQGPFGQVLYGRYQLPGLLAPSELEEWEDGVLRRFGLLHVPGDNSYVVVLICDPNGVQLSDQEVVDQRVAHYGMWLTRLGGERHLISASVTVQTEGDPGTALRREVETQSDPDAHPIPQAVVAEIVRTYPIDAPKLRAWVALTFTGAGRKREDVAQDLRIRMPGLVSALAGSGAGAVRPATAAQLCEIARTAYDPAAAARFEAARAAGQPLELTWDQVGPTHAVQAPDRYRTDSGEHVTWVVTEPPRGEVHENAMARLLGPRADVPIKRVTIKYRPLDPGRSARTVDADVKTASSHAKRAPSDERAQRVWETAKRTAQEEARGAGLVDYSVLITATVTDPDQLDDVASAVENLCAASRLDARRLYGGQSVGFAAALPFGLVTARHQRMPAELTA